MRYRRALIEMAVVSVIGGLTALAVFYAIQALWL